MRDQRGKRIFAMGKGSKRRPRAVSRDQFDKNWERVFGNKPGKPDSWNKALLRDAGAVKRIKQRGK